MSWLKHIFPMREHMQNEIEYLRSQLSQKQRHIDELQSALVEKITPKVRSESKSTVPPKVIRGWDAYRVRAKREREEERQEEDEERVVSEGS